MRKIAAVLGCGVLCGCLLTACFLKKKKEAPLSPEQLSLPATICCGTAADDSLPLLPEGLQNQIYRFLKHMPGSGCTLRADFPESWQLEGAFPSPSSDYDLWLVSDKGEGIYKVLLTVSAPEDPAAEREALSALVVAYSYAVEKPGQIESEEWQSELDDTWGLCIRKKYECLRSLSDSVETALAGKETETKDCFRLQVESGRFVYVEPEYNEAYRAVIQFADTTRISLASDTAWLANAMAMQEALEPENIYFMELFQGFEHVMVTNYLGELVDEVDLSDFLKNYSRGYLVLEKGKKPRYLRYCPATEALGKILGLWGLEYRPNEDGEDVVSF